MTADQCSKDDQCVTVKRNVIYDKNANDGNGLTDKQKAQFEKGLLEDAKNEYGDAKVHFDVSYSTGAVDTEKSTVTGTVLGAFNVVVTDGRFLSASGGSQIVHGKALTFINMDRADNDILSHELAHHFTGDTRGMLNSMLSHDPLTRFVANAVNDIVNDWERGRLRIVGPSFGVKNPIGEMPMTTPFNKGAADFQKAITPSQK